MAIYTATYQTDVIIGQDGYSPVTVSNVGDTPYNDFIALSKNDSLFIFGIAVSSYTFEQLNKPFVVFESDARGKSINYTSLINPDSFIKQNVGIAEFEAFEIGGSNYIDYTINNGETVIFDIYFSDKSLENADRSVAIFDDVQTRKLDYIYDYKEFPDFSNRIVEAFMKADLTNDMIKRKDAVIVESIENGLKELVNLDDVIKNAGSYKPKKPFVAFMRLFVS